MVLFIVGLGGAIMKLALSGHPWVAGTLSPLMLLAGTVFAVYAAGVLGVVIDIDDAKEILRARGKA